MPHVDFDEQSQSAPEPSDVTFTLDGRVWTCRDRLDIETNVVASHLRASAALYADPDDSSLVVKAAEASEAFLRAVLMPEEGDEFIKALSSKKDLTGRLYQGVLRMLLEHATARPTTPAAASSSGRKRTARKSTAGSSSRATRRAASAG